MAIAGSCLCVWSPAIHVRVVLLSTRASKPQASCRVSARTCRESSSCVGWKQYCILAVITEILEKDALVVK